MNAVQIQGLPGLACPMELISKLLQRHPLKRLVHGSTVTMFSRDDSSQSALVEWSLAADPVPITVKLTGVAGVTTVDWSRTSRTNGIPVGVGGDPAWRRSGRCGL